MIRLKSKQTKGDNEMIVTETEYLPNYMWMDEIKVQYDLDKGLQKVENGQWREARAEKIEQLKQKYNA